MTIKVTNKSSREIKVSINVWGPGGDTTFFTIKPEELEEWDRSDKRGFIMALEKESSRASYFVLHDSDVLVESNSVIRDSQKIEPLS